MIHHTPYPFGFIDVMRPSGEFLEISGWLLWLEGPADRLEYCRCPGEPRVAEQVIRRDLAAAMPRIPNAERGGFYCRVPLEDLAPGRVCLITLEAFRHHQILGRRTLYYYIPEKPPPLPPPPLMERANGNPEPDFFLATGMQNCFELLTAADKHLPLAGISNYLEWGCGAGRISRHLQHQLPHARGYGVDKDPEAVEWLQGNLPSGIFRTGSELPPLDFPENFFDLILVASVLPLVPRHRHARWIKEFTRILAPGAILVLTTHGYHAAINMFQPYILECLDRDGIYDGLNDKHLAANDPNWQYARIFQTAGYTRRTWGQTLIPTDYRDAAMNCFDEIWVFRKSGP